MLHKKLLCTTAAVLWLMSTGLLHAAPVTFTDKAIFDANTSPTLQRENFADGSDINGFNSEPSLQFNGNSNGPITMTITEINSPLNNGNNLQINASGAATEGANFIRYESDPSSVTFAFDQQINSFGLDIIDFGFQNFTALNGTLSISTDGVTNLANTTILTANGNLAQNNTAFFGIVDITGGFSTVTITSTTDADIIAFDGVRFGRTPIPEPSSFVLGGFALLSFGGAAWRKRKKKKLAVTT